MQIIVLEDAGAYVPGFLTWVNDGEHGLCGSITHGEGSSEDLMIGRHVLWLVFQSVTLMRARNQFGNKRGSRRVIRYAAGRVLGSCLRFLIAGLLRSATVLLPKTVIQVRAIHQDDVNTSSLPPHSCSTAPTSASSPTSPTCASPPPPAPPGLLSSPRAY